MEHLVFIALILVIGILVAIIQGRAAMARRKALAQWAGANSLDYNSRKNYGVDDEYPSFECLKKGNNRYAYNLLAGKLASRPFFGFDYHYEVTTSTGKHTQTQHYYFSAIIIESPFLLKPLFIRPENFMDKLGELVGIDDIDFESAQFSREFYVKSPDKKWAYDIIHQGMMEYLLGAPRFSIQFDFKHIMIWRNSLFEVNDFETAADMVNGIFQRIPEYVVLQQKTQY